jgi:hypothetical protein
MRGFIHNIIIPIILVKFSCVFWYNNNMLSPNYQLYFFDTEFSMRGEHTELISLGITTLNDVNYYGVSSEFNLEGIDPWLETNVISKLPPKSSWIPRDTIKQEVQEFLSQMQLEEVKTN